MRLFSFIKKLFNKESIETIPNPANTDTKISIIDTSNLEIDRNLTDEELESRNKLFKEIFSGNFSTFITYGDNIEKKINYYLEIFRKRIDQNIQDTLNISKFTNIENAINLKVKIMFNDAEIDSIIEELESLRRDCELRIIALEDLGNQELEKGKRKIFFFGNKTEQVKITAINNVIGRLSTSINIINTLVYSMKKEKDNHFLENSALDNYISNSDQEVVNKVTNKVLDEKFEELINSITAISTFSNMPQININGIKLSNFEIKGKSIDEKVKIIAITKRYLDLYVAQNRKKLLEPNGMLDNAKYSLIKLSEEIKSDYYDRALWSKKFFSTVYEDENGNQSIESDLPFTKYNKQITNIENFISIFNEELPDDFKEDFYKTKFYYYALLFEINEKDADVSSTIPVKSEEERNYYIKFIESTIEKIHIISADGELLRFMDKHLPISESSQILEQYERLVALIRIEKYGRNGLYTLMLFNNDFNDYFDKESLDLQYCCLEQISRKFVQSNELTIYEYYFGNLAKDILQLWKSDEHKDDENSYNYFWEDYNISMFSHSFHLPRNNPSNRFDYVLEELFKFIDDTNTKLNRKLRLEESKPEDQRLWNSNFIILNCYPDDSQNSETDSKPKYIRISLSELISNISIAIEKITNGLISKEKVRDRILNFKSLKLVSTKNGYMLMYEDNKNSIAKSHVIPCNITYKDVSSYDEYPFVGKFIQNLLSQILIGDSNYTKENTNNPILLQSKALLNMLINKILFEMYGNKDNHFYELSEPNNQSIINILNSKDFRNFTLNQKYLESVFSTLDSKGIANIFLDYNECVKLITENAYQLTGGKKDESLLDVTTRGKDVGIAINQGTYKEKEHC